MRLLELKTSSGSIVCGSPVAAGRCDAVHTPAAPRRERKEIAPAWLVPGLQVVRTAPEGSGEGSGGRSGLDNSLGRSVVPCCIGDRSSAPTFSNVRWQPWARQVGVFASCADLPEAPAPPQHRTGNAQQCRRHKALMGHTAAGCFPSTRVGRRLLCST